MSSLSLHICLYLYFSSMSSLSLHIFLYLSLASMSSLSLHIFLYLSLASMSPLRLHICLCLYLAPISFLSLLIHYIQHTTWHVSIRSIMLSCILLYIDQTVYCIWLDEALRPWSRILLKLLFIPKKWVYSTVASFHHTSELCSHLVVPFTSLSTRAKFGRYSEYIMLYCEC